MTNPHCSHAPAPKPFGKQRCQLFAPHEQDEECDNRAVEQRDKKQPQRNEKNSNNDFQYFHCGNV